MSEPAVEHTDRSPWNCACCTGAIEKYMELQKKRREVEAELQGAREAWFRAERVHFDAFLDAEIRNQP